jgi:putative photosynthetic complex assembly protein
MTMTTQVQNREQELIPKVLLRAMVALALSVVLIVGYARLTDREPAGQPIPGKVLEQRQISLIGGGAKAVTVLDENGKVLLDLAHGGFITVIQNGLQTERARHGVDPALPVLLIRMDNNRLTLQDPETGWSAELHAFGGDNKAAFERLLSH